MKYYVWLSLLVASSILRCAEQRQINDLVSAAYKGDLDAVKKELAQDAAINGLYQSDQFFDPLTTKTALGVAIEEDHASVIDYLLNQPNIDINRPTLFDYQVQTPLAIAVEKNKPDLVKKLIQHKADVNAQPGQFTPIFYALISGSIFSGSSQDTTPVIQILIDAGANLYAKDPISNGTMLSFALSYIEKNKAFSNLKALFNKGLDINAPINDQGQTLGHAAVEKNLPNLLQFLLDQGIRTDIADNKGKTVLTTALHPNLKSWGEEQLPKAEEIQKILNQYQEKMALHKAALQQTKLTPEELQKFGPFPHGITTEIANYLVGPLTPGQKKELDREVKDERMQKTEKPSKTADELSTLLAQERNKVTRLKSELRKFLSPKEFDALMMEIEKS